MRLPATRLIVPDGSGQLAVGSASWRWTYGTDIVIPVVVLHQDGSAYDLSADTDGLLAFKQSETDTLPTLQVRWTLTEANAAEFRLPRSLAPRLPVLDLGYAVGIQFRDADSDIEDCILLTGRVNIARAIADFSAPVDE